MTPSGIEPATFRLVAQCLNQLSHRVPHSYWNTEIINSDLCLIKYFYSSWQKPKNRNPWRWLVRLAHSPLELQGTILAPSCQESGPLQCRSACDHGKSNPCPNCKSYPDHPANCYILLTNTHTPTDTYVELCNRQRAVEWKNKYSIFFHVSAIVKERANADVITSNAALLRKYVSKQFPLISVENRSR